VIPRQRAINIVRKPKKHRQPRVTMLKKRNDEQGILVTELEGKVAFITGGASGIGLGLAKALAEEAGMKVAIADIQDARIAEAAAYFASGGREELPVHIVRLDVTDRNAFSAAADEVESVFGPVQLLANNAGVSARVPVDKATYDDWDWHLSVNLYGAINGVRTFVPRMVERAQGGHILNTGSLQSFFALPSAALYTTSKFAIRGLTEGLSVDLERHGIGVSCLCPGAVNTNIMDSTSTRPARYASTGFEGHGDKMKSILEAGMDPLDLARIAVEGIRRGDLWIFPYPEYLERIEARHQLVRQELLRWA
jgi:NAD(P)-dependent dehydrogenase (short-subunit alcohol dehydrogenase family)